MSDTASDSKGAAAGDGGGAAAAGGAGGDDSPRDTADYSTRGDKARDPSFFNDALSARGTKAADFFRGPEEVKSILDDFHRHLGERTRHHLGYPYNLQFDSDQLSPFLQYSVNNLGDPFVPSNYGVHSRRFELEVLDFFADLWGIARDDYWGYTTTCGTEGNLLGVLYGREKLPDAVLYCSRDTHYSVPKAAYLYRIPLVMVRSQSNGEIDYEDLEVKLRENAGKPAIVNVNAGTTVKGAVDSCAQVLDVLRSVGLTRDQFYVHVDGALAGLIVPLCETVYAENYAISFDKDIDSISVSGHKMLGCPMPCGVVITRKEHMERFQRDVEYLNSRDATIMGSRNGQAPLAMWVALQKHHGIDGLRDNVLKCIANARYLRDLFERAGVRVDLNPLSTTVVFEKPASEEFVLKWQLACTGDIAHVVVMPSSGKDKLKAFFDEYMKDRAAAEAAAGGAEGGAAAKAAKAAKKVEDGAVDPKRRVV